MKMYVLEMGFLLHSKNNCTLFLHQKKTKKTICKTFQIDKFSNTQKKAIKVIMEMICLSSQQWEVVRH